jgi:hypothetical protein
MHLRLRSWSCSGKSVPPLHTSTSDTNPWRELLGGRHVGATIGGTETSTLVLYTQSSNETLHCLYTAATQVHPTHFTYMIILNIATGRMIAQPLHVFSASNTDYYRVQPRGEV